MVEEEEEGRKEGTGGHPHLSNARIKRKAFVSCCATSSCGGRGKEKGVVPVFLILPHPWGARSGAGPGALRAPPPRPSGLRALRSAVRPPLSASPALPPPSPRSRPLSRSPSPRLPRSAAPLNPGSRPASRLALNNCLPPAKRPWGKYLLNGNNCPGSRGGLRLFRAYWFLAPALVNKPALKRPPRAAPCPRPPAPDSDRGEKRDGGGRWARPLRDPPAPLRPKLRLLPEGSPRRGPLRAGPPLLGGSRRPPRLQTLIIIIE